MTRYLAETLEINPLEFKNKTTKLESRTKHPRHDIRLTSEISAALNTSLKCLELDPSDTTAKELYYSLNQKLKNDDQKLLKEIRTLAAKKVNLEANVSDGIKILLDEIKIDGLCFGLKSRSFSKLIKKMPPLKVMKALNYRSIESLFKHEPISLIILAINNFESKSYLNRYYLNYKKLKPTDFELRKISIIQSRSKKWDRILESIAVKTNLSSIACYETSCLILLPEVNYPKTGKLTRSIIEDINEISKIMAVSTFIKLNQVNANFGQILYEIAEREPVVNINEIEHSVSWSHAHSTLAKKNLILDIPQLSDEDFSLSNLSHKLSEVVEDFKFWERTSFLAYIRNNEVISLNILDVSENLTKQLEFEARKLNHLKKSLWEEFIGRYITPELIKDSLENNQNINMPIEIADF